MDFKVVNKGIDSIYLSHKASVMTNFLEELESKKQLAQSKDIREQAEADIQINDHFFEVSARGFKPYKYALSDNWYHIKVAGAATQKIPDFHTQVSSELLNCRGLDFSLNALRKIIETKVETINNENISRVDLFVDVVTDMDFENINMKSLVTRAVRKNPYYEHDVLTGWTIGQGGDISLRIYNKTIEIEKKNKAFFKDIWKDNGWNENETVWRIEFQLRKTFLKQMSVQTIDEFKMSINDLWRYCTENWLRLCVMDGTLNQSRWDTHPFWEAVQKIKFEHGLMTGITRSVDKTRVPPDRILFINGFGYIASFAAKYNITDFDEIIMRFTERLIVFLSILAKHDSRYEDAFDYMNQKIALKRKTFNIPRKDYEDENS